MDPCQHSAAALLALLAGSAMSGQALAQSTEPFPAQFQLSSLLPANGGDGTNGFVLNGIDADDYSGISASSAGDINGDGIDDLIIGASRAYPNGIPGAGESYVVFGGSGVSAGGLIELSSLNGLNGFVLNGIDTSDRSGISVSSAGDVNGDGIDDLIIGASGPFTVSVPGESYVVFGGVGIGSTGVLELSSLNGTNGFVLNGIDAGDYAGISVSSAGDVNGDGIDDLIIGAIYADPNGISGAGESYVVFGGVGVGSTGVIELSSLNGTNGYVLNGIDAADYSGRGVSSAGDVNDDGIDDLIIGARRADPNGNNVAGESYVVFGGVGVGSTGAIELASLNGTNGFVLNGTSSGAFSGTVSSAGDVNNDGIADLIIGATGSDESYVVFGGAGVGSTGVIELSSLNGTNGFVLNLLNSGNVSSAGDVNGDGIDDLIIAGTAAFASGDPDNIYVVFGSVGVGSTGVIQLASLDGSNGFVLNGIDLGDQAGGSVSSAGDVNDDGIDDLIIGAYFADPNGLDKAGESYVVFGRATQVWARSGGGAFEDVVNWVSGSSPSGGTVNIEPRFGGIVTLSQPADIFLDSLTLGSERGVATLDVGPSSLLGVDEPLGLAASAAISGSGILVADAGISNNGVISGPDLTILSMSGVGNRGMIDVDGRVSGGLSSVRVIGTLTNESSGEVLLSHGGTELAADAIANAGEIDVAFADATVRGDLTNAQVMASRIGFVLNGIDASDRSGRSVSSAGDVNGDGFGDLIIGAAYAEPNGNNSGESYVVFGGVGVGSTGAVNLSSLDGSNGFVLNGIDTLDQSGRSVSSAGDVNGDGIDDLIIGALYADPNGINNAGESYVILGGVGVGSSGSIDLASLNGTNGFVLNGIDAYDGSGRSVSSAGDVDGDGIDDLIIGAFSADPNGISGAGESYVVFGDATLGSSGSINLSSLNGVNGFVVNGIEPYDRSSGSVSSAGDVNGDGIGDLVIGASTADPNGISNAGESYVVFGGTGVGSTGAINLSSLNGSNGFVLNGIDQSDFSGYSVSAAGDVNGDGIDDLIIGAYLADPGGNGDAGESYVVFGGVGVGSTGVIELSSLNGTNGFVLNGIDLFDYSGSAVSSAGDVNGDGIDDLIIGARYAGPNGNDYSGESYVVFGGIGVGSTGAVNLSALNGSNGFVLNGIDGYDRSGRSVSSAGDVNGDGIDDLIIGALYADPNGINNAGESYVILGRGATDEPFPAVIELSALDATFESVAFGLITAASSSELLFNGNVANPGTIVLNADSEISILGSLSGNGVNGPSGPGSAGPVFAFDGIFPGPPPAGPGTRGLAPASAGIMHFDGHLDLGTSAYTIIEIGGTTPGVTMDQLSSALNLGAGGTLEVQLVNGYAPQPGDVYPVLQFTTASGSFNNIVLDPGLLAAGAITDDLLTNGIIFIAAPCQADTNGDGILDNGDIGTFVAFFLAGNLAADFNGDGILDNGDIGAFVAAFLAGC